MRIRRFEAVDIEYPRSLRNLSKAGRVNIAVLFDDQSWQGPLAGEGGSSRSAIRTPFMPIDPAARDLASPVTSA